MYNEPDKRRGVHEWPEHNKPFCDSTRKKTRDEEPDAVYIHDAQGRVKVPTEY